MKSYGTAKCVECNIDFVKRSGNQKRCGQQCMDAAQTRSKRAYEEKKKQMRRSRGDTLVCHECNNKFVYEWGVQTRCKPCQAEHKRKSYERARFGGQKKAVLNRDNHSCQRCGKTGKHLAIHHINGRGESGSMGEADNRMENLVTLCHSCHRYVHHYISRMLWAAYEDDVISHFNDCVNGKESDCA